MSIVFCLMIDLSTLYYPTLAVCLCALCVSSCLCALFHLLCCLASSASSGVMKFVQTGLLISTIQIFNIVYPFASAFSIVRAFLLHHHCQSLVLPRPLFLCSLFLFLLTKTGGCTDIWFASQWWNQILALSSLLLPPSPFFSLLHFFFSLAHSISLVISTYTKRKV